MRRFVITFLALLLPMTNIVVAADVHAETYGGRHHPDMELHLDDHGDQGKDGKHHECPHCCHAQGHLSSLPQRSHTDWAVAPGHDWTLNDSTHPHPLQHAPPVPPPKA